MPRKKSYQKMLQYYLVALLILGSFVVGLFFGRSNVVADNVASQARTVDVQNAYTDKSDEVDFDDFWQVWDLINKKFALAPVDSQKVLHGAIKGMVAALDDPYSAYLNPEETKDFQGQIDGSFEGIGAEISIKDERLTVIAPLDGSPAQKAGLQAQDVIALIDETDTSQMTLFEAVRLIRGEKGTSVRLTVLREGVEEPLTIDITRDTIDVEAVSSEIKTANDKQVLYLKISTFSKAVSEELFTAINGTDLNSVDGVVVDLRSNSGGLLEEAVYISSAFIPKGEIVVREMVGEEEVKEFATDEDPLITDLPIVVLVDGGTASASEIVAGALRDHLGSKLVGTQTFGKGTVQEYIEVNGGGSLRVSIAKWLTPNGTDINKEGLTVDEEVDFTQEDSDADRDPQLDRALELVTE